MKTSTIDHYIQRGILRTLSLTDSLRFSALKPSGLESNLFMYHLKQLLRQGLVAKEAQGYTLTTRGLQYVARVRRTNLDARIMPTLISLIVVQNEYGEYAMHPRPAQPFLKYLTFPGGVLYFGEELQAHAKLQVEEKLGFPVALSLRGTASLRLRNEAILLTHAHAQIFFGTVAGRPLIRCKDPRITCRWVNISECKSPLLPDVPIILRHLQQNQHHFFADIQQTVTSAALS